MSFARNFAMGQQIAQTAMDSFDQARLGKIMSETKDAKVKELAEVEDAVVKPVNQDAPGQPQATDAAPVKDVAQPVIASAEHPFANPDVPTLPADPVAVAPKVPDAVAEQPQRIQVSPKQYQFLGKTYDQPLTDDQMKAARTDSLKGRISELFNPVRGLKQMRELELQDQEDWKFGLMKTEAAHKAEERKKQENIKQAGVKALKESDFGQVNAAYSQDLSAWQEENAKRQAQIEAGTPEADLPPVRAKPVMPVISPARMIASNLAIMNAQVAAGADFDPKTFASHAEAYQKLQEQGWGRALSAIAQGATIDDVAKLVAQNGKPGFDPKNVVADVTKTDENGIKNRVITYFDPVQKRNITIDTAVEQAAIGEIDKQMDKLLKLSQINYHNSGTRLRKAQTDAQVANVDAIKALAGQREAAARVSDARADGTLPGATGRGGKVDPTTLSTTERAKFDIAELIKAGDSTSKLTPSQAASASNYVDSLAALNPKANYSQLKAAAVLAATNPNYLKQAPVEIDKDTGQIVRAIRDPINPEVVTFVGRPRFDALTKDERNSLDLGMRDVATTLGVDFPTLRNAARSPERGKQVADAFANQSRERLKKQLEEIKRQTGRDMTESELERAVAIERQKAARLLDLAKQLYQN